MEGELKMKRQQIILIVFAGVFFSTGTAMANNPPSGQTFLSMISILPLMILFSMVGGAYVILKQRQPGKSSKVFRNIGIGLAILFSMAHESAGDWEPWPEGKNRPILARHVHGA